MKPSSPLSPAEALLDDGDAVAVLPACDHYAGVEARMRKSLALQTELGPVFDVTLDCEDGAPVGGEAEHAKLVVDVATSSANVHGRVGVRVHPVDHSAFGADVETIVGGAASRLAFVMLPKVERAADIDIAVAAIDAAGGRALPLHALIETHGALREIQALAAHPRIESLSFGLMDFVLCASGCDSGLGDVGRGPVQPSARRAREGRDRRGLPRLRQDAVALRRHRVRRRRRRRGRGPGAPPASSATRGCGASIRTRSGRSSPRSGPRPPRSREAAAILDAAAHADWAPIRRGDVLHDRASYRYFWRVLRRAALAPDGLPDDIRRHFLRQRDRRLVTHSRCCGNGR